MHPVRMGQRARKATQLHGGGLDRARGAGLLLVLHRLRTAAGLWRDPLAGGKQLDLPRQSLLCIIE